MKARSPSGWLLVLVALAGVLLGVSLVKRSARSIRACGWETRLVGASYGIDHFAPPQRWNRIKSALPRRFLQFARTTRPVPTKSKQPQMVIWLETRPADANRNAEGELRLEWAEGVGLRGVPFRTLSQLEVLQASGRSGAEELSSWHRQGLVTQVFPRRMSTLPFALFWLGDSGEVTRLGELSVPNPVRESFPRWQAESLPAYREVESVRVELEHFVVDPHEGSDGYRWASAVFRISREGKGLTEWGVEAMELRDPTGNRVVYGRHRHGGTMLPLRSHPSKAGRLVVELPWLGWEAEPVWEMTLELRPVGVQALVVDDPSVVLRSIRAPSKDGVTLVDKVVSLGGLEVQVLGLAGAHASLPDRAHDVFGQSVVELEVPRLAQGQHLGVLVTDERGETLPPGQPFGEEGESIGFLVPEDAEVLDLALVLYLERRVSFRVSE